MGNQLLSLNWSGMLAHTPAYALLLFVVPVLGLVALKMALLTRASGGPKSRTEWVLLREQDAEGIPVLAWSKLEKPEVLARKRALLQAQMQRHATWPKP